MEIAGELKYKFTLGESKFSFQSDVNNEAALISLCLSNDLIQNFCDKLKLKQKKTSLDKHNLTCMKNTSYILRQFIQGSVSDLIKDQKEKEQPKEEISETPA